MGSSKMKKHVIKVLRRIEMLNNQRKLIFEIIIKDKIPRIKVQEKHEKKVRWAIRLLTLMGICISIVTFSKWYYALTVSVTLLLLNQILEKIIFTYTVMIVQPMPVKWDGAAWSMMVIGMFNNKYVLGFGFNKRDVAYDFFNTILSWNNYELVNEKNINISLILEDDDNYSVHVYPSIERDFVLKAIEKSEKDFKLEQYGKDQTNLVMQMNICKVFPNGAKSAYNYLKNVSDGIYISIYDTRKFSESNPDTIRFLRPFDDKKILCKNIKVKKRSQLNKQKDTIEYFYIPKY